MRSSWLAPGVLWFTLVACAPEPVGLDAPTSAEPDALDAVRALLEIPDHLQVPHVPWYNPITADKIALGRALFYDRRLSANQTQACVDCHDQALAFSDGETTPTGSTGDVLARNSQHLSNVAYSSSLTWAHPGLTDLEDQLLVPITAEFPTELGVNDGVRAEVLARFDDDPDTAKSFASAFPDSDSGATLNKVAFALASFCRSMISAGSDYDRYLTGDSAALTAEQQLGLTLFNGERFECFHCHGGTHFTSSYRDAGTPEGSIQRPFFNTGLYNIGGDGSYPLHDQGLHEVTLDPDDRGFFRAPSLRNVALTAPYMHDGSMESLREVVEHYAAGGRLIEDGPFAGDGRINPYKSGLVRSFTATDAEIDAVVAFLEALTDLDFVESPAYSNPSPQ